MNTLLRGLFRLLGWVVGLGLVAVAILYLFFIRAVQVGHNGMAPTLLAGEQAVLWRDADIEMGDIALCEHPGRKGRFVMGRVVGKRGMRIEAPRGQLQIEGSTVDRDIQGDLRFFDTTADRTVTMVRGVEILGNTEHQYFIRKDDHLRLRPTEVTAGLYLLGDNRSNRADDSRAFGEVDPDECIGTVFMRLRPNPDDPNELGHGWLQWIK